MSNSKSPSTASPSAFLPFFSHTSASATLALRHGEKISVAQFCADVERLAAQLPQARYMLIGCEDRYEFAVCFAAALVRDQVAVLPHNHLPATLESLSRDYPGLYCIAPSDATPMPVTKISYPSGYAQIRSHHKDSPRIPCFSSDRLAAILFTSGSTGLPKAHPRHWGTIVASAKAEGAALFGTTIDQYWSVLGTVPAQHSYGFESTLHLPLQCHGVLVAERPFFPDDVQRALSALPPPSLLVTTPVHLRAMVEASAANAHCPASKVLSATAPLPESLARATETLTKAKVFEIYGSTESGQLATRRTLDGPIWSLMGDAQLTADTDEPLRAWAHGGHVETRVMMGDHLRLVDEKRFELIGRTNDVVNIGGKRGSLAALNHALLQVAGVRDGAMLLQDEHDNVRMRLAAIVVVDSKDDAQALADIKRDIKRELSLRIEAAFMPRRWVFVDALPRNANGKLTASEALKLLAQTP